MSDDEAPARAPLPAAAAGDERRARILDAALTEFVDKGFAGASTNAIAERAGVAKGLVFHHFTSKDELFVAVAEDVIGKLIAAFDAAMVTAPVDIFARVEAWTVVKLRLMGEDPRRLRFFVVSMGEAPEPVRARTRAASEALVKASLPKLAAGIDASKLRAGISADDVLEAMWTVTSGLERMAMPLLTAAKGAEEAVAQVTTKARRLLGFLKAGLYREEER